MVNSIIVGTSTDIGKTFVTCKIIDECRKNGQLIDVIKPVITGFNIDDENCDTVKILRRLGRSIDDESVKSMSPFRLKAPISPISAAKIEGLKIEYDEVLSFCRDKIEKSLNTGDEDLLIETAGGIMSPICERKTFLDLVEDLKIDVILVGSCFLGGISAILTAFEALKSRNITNIRIIINNNVDFDGKFLKIDDFIDEVRHFVDCEVFLVDNFFYFK